MIGVFARAASCCILLQALSSWEEGDGVHSTQAGGDEEAIGWNTGISGCCYGVQRQGRLLLLLLYLETRLLATYSALCLLACPLACTHTTHFLLSLLPIGRPAESVPERIERLPCMGVDSSACLVLQSIHIAALPAANPL